MTEKLIQALEFMAQEFVKVLQFNNNLLEENLRLWKENIKLSENGTKRD